MEKFVPLSIILLIIVSMAYFDYRKAKTIDELYASINVGDHLKITLNIYDADPWTSPYISYATIIDKKNGWIKIKYDDGSYNTIEFTVYNFDTINTLEKI